MRFKNFRLLILCGLLLSLSVLAQIDNVLLHSDWMELVKGSRDEALGAELREIEDTDGTGTRKITLAIPKSAIRHPDAIEEVVVVGRKPEKPEKPEPLDITYEWLDDYDNDNYGLVIRLGKDTNWPIRLYLNSDPGYIR
ncbi:MAG: hypothetical protein DRR04_06375 [Gammaproteobacteria bacterium]|nr:MAG: hypothetical protein DRQ97_07720 [Gammaproteobacteria bacterium]RLA60175.1 MAG: hypothetical protein DRR04_06375 [Gammaproteobacteria bacterium]